ncbi:HAMP domain-containing protein [Thiospirochaeta perfilievii]|uniref:HAMP domain-containing protein n=1 Tax=Thiospirochaeta perfilievii TaxID=252967 RepID=A0A5C1QBB9_9SPIO|nr:SpoIIE family protein phosphatase [Thiospirochaeta perfilievii]QEN03954.1 HAMP domain-containing protein [Thiospirochaeta perfilievii]
MKIRTKITYIQLTTVFCILLSIGVLYRSFTDIEELKQLQVNFNRLIDIEYNVNDMLYNSLYINENIVEFGIEVTNKFNALISLVDFMYKDITKNHKYLDANFKQFYYQWHQKNSNYYLPLAQNFREYVSPTKGWIPIISNHGLLKGYDILLDEESKGLGDEARIKQLKSTIDLIKNNKLSQKVIEDQIKIVQEDLQYNINVSIAGNSLLLIILLIFIVTAATMMSSRISKSLIKKVHNVETSLEKIAEGDLSSQVIDNSGDEFTDLAKSFNTLSTMLIGKTASMKEIMNEISEIISKDVNIDALLIKITELAKQSSKADAATILLVDKFSDILRVEHLEGFFPPPYSVSISVKSKRSLIEEKFKSTPIPFHSSYLTKESVLKGEPLFVKDSEEESDKLPFNSNPQDILFIKSSMTIPLVVSNKLLGVISLAKTNREETFSDLDFSNMVSFVEYVSLTIDNLYKYMELLEKSEMKREMNIASEIQTQLLPKKIPVLPNVDISAFSDSARGISGDYYDIYKISKDKSVATVCDVAGKGIAAALVLVIIRTILQLASNSKSTAKDLLTFLNKSISDRVKTDYFATLSVLVYDNSNNSITLSIAGDTPVLIYRSKEQVVERITHSDVPVGIDNTTIYSNKSISLNEDDVLYMFSDGLLEVRNDFNDVFSINELESFILEHSNNRTETITVLLKDYLNEFRGAQNRIDDETVIVFKKI